MDHVAIMNPKWKLVDRIVSWAKTIESRWYKTRRAPWDRVCMGDVIYFKDSGKMITACASVSRVLQFSDLDLLTIESIVCDYGERIGLVDTNFINWWLNKRYCILMFLVESRRIDKPFAIEKNGFGTGAAWLSVESVDSIIVS